MIYLLEVDSKKQSNVLRPTIVKILRTNTSIHEELS
jgi:hypothetical protein